MGSCMSSANPPVTLSQFQKLDVPVMRHFWRNTRTTNFSAWDPRVQLLNQKLYYTTICKSQPEEGNVAVTDLLTKQTVNYKGEPPFDRMLAKYRTFVAGQRLLMIVVGGAKDGLQVERLLAWDVDKWTVLTGDRPPVLPLAPSTPHELHFCQDDSRPDQAFCCLENPSDIAGGTRFHFYRIRLLRQDRPERFVWQRVAGIATDAHDRLIYFAVRNGQFYVLIKRPMRVDQYTVPISDTPLDPDVNSTYERPIIVPKLVDSHPQSIGKYLVFPPGMRKASADRNEKLDTVTVFDTETLKCIDTGVRFPDNYELFADQTTNRLYAVSIDYGVQFATLKY